MASISNYPTEGASGSLLHKECDVCYEPYTAEAPANTLHCGHTFHANCVEKHFNEQIIRHIREGADPATTETNCPLCRDVCDLTAQRAQSEEIVKAVEAADIKKVEQLLEDPKAKLYLNLISTTGKVAICSASILGDIDIIDKLNAHGADLDAYNGRGITSAFIATAHHKIDVLGYLLAHGASHAPSQYDEYTPLLFAANYDNGEAIDLLARYGANPNQKETSSGMSVLSLAVGKGARKSVKALVEAGADVNVKTPKGMTGLHLAVLKGDLPMVWTLLDLGADPTITTDGNACTALEFAENIQDREMIARALGPHPGHHCVIDFEEFFNAYVS